MNLEDLRQHIDELRSQLVATAAHDHGTDQVERLRILLGAYERLEERLNLPGPRPTFHSVAGRRRPSVAPMGLATTLKGCRSVGITVSQFFRIHDLLYFPSTVRPTRWSEMVNDATVMRRALDGAISLDDLGTFYPMPRNNRFWKHGRPDLRYEGHRPPILYFLPFQLSPLPPGRERVSLSLLVQELVNESLGTSADLVSYSSVGSSLRLYPSGIGIIRLRITLHLKQDVFVELLARVARDIESLLFVDPSGNKFDVNAVLGELVEEVCDRLFTDRGGHERRWQPPHTVFELDQGHFDPEEHVRELAYLMSLSPRETQSFAKLQRRVIGKLKGSHWVKEGILAVTAPRVMLLTYERTDTPTPPARPRELDDIVEAHELITAAHHAREAFLKELEDLAAKGLPDASWAENETDFEYMRGLLTSMRRAFQAVASVRTHLQNTNIGVVIPVAREATTAIVHGEPGRTRSALLSVSQWAADNRAGRESRMLDIVTLAEIISTLDIPFYDPKRVETTQTSSAEETLESDMLAAMEELDTLLQSERVDYERLDFAVFAAESNRRKLLGIHGT